MSSLLFAANVMLDLSNKFPFLAGTEKTISDLTFNIFQLNLVYLVEKNKGHSLNFFPLLLRR